MNEYISQRSSATRKLAKKGQAIPKTKQLPNSLMNRLMSGNNTLPAGGQNLDSLKSSILSRMPAMSPHAPRMQAQIPAAENEAERLSANIHASTPDTVKVAMGSRLGADFSSVHFHTDAASAAKADAMGALAYTAGNDIYFGSGGFEASAAAHELVHTVQQGVVDGVGVSVQAPLGGIQMLGNPVKWMKRKVKGQTVEEQEAEEKQKAQEKLLAKQKKAEMKQIAKERKAAAKADKKLRGTPYGAEGNKRKGIGEKLKHAVFSTSDAIASPLVNIVGSHLKTLDDINLNSSAFKQLSTWEQVKHLYSNPLAHLRSGKKTMQDSVKRHMKNNVMPQIEAFGAQLEMGEETLNPQDQAAANKLTLQEKMEKGKSAYSGRGVVNLKHVDIASQEAAREAKRKEMLKQQYLQEKALKAQGKTDDPLLDDALANTQVKDAITPPSAEKRAAAGEAATKNSLAALKAKSNASFKNYNFSAGRSRAIEANKALLAGRALKRPDMTDPGKGYVKGGFDYTSLVAKIADKGVGTLGEQVSGIGDKLQSLEDKLEPHHVYLHGLGGFTDAMKTASPYAAAVGNSGGIVSEGMDVFKEAKKAHELRKQGDTAGTVQHAFESAEHMFNIGGKITESIGNFAPVNSVLGSVTGGLTSGGSLGANLMKTGAGLTQGIQGSLTAKHTDQLMDKREYEARHGKTVSEDEKKVLKSAAQFRRQADVEQAYGYSKAASGALKATGDVVNIATTASGVGAVPGAIAGTLLGTAASGVEFIGKKVAENKLKDIQHTVANQEVSLDSAVNKRLKSKYSEEQWRNMSGYEREKARKKEEKVLMYYHGQKQGDLEQFTIEESQKRARFLTEQAGQSTDSGALAEQLIKGSGLKKMKDGKYSEKAVGRKLYSRDGKDLDEMHKERELKLGSGIQAKLRKQREAKKAKAAKKAAKAQKSAPTTTPAPASTTSPPPTPTTTTTTPAQTLALAKTIQDAAKRKKKGA
ncbi:MAG: DUF4157 domain-containing protein [Desulfosporosinus sp.]|jgi:hypothetical protein